MSYIQLVFFFFLNNVLTLSCLSVSVLLYSACMFSPGYFFWRFLNFKIENIQGHNGNYYSNNPCKSWREEAKGTQEIMRYQALTASVNLDFTECSESLLWHLLAMLPQEVTSLSSFQVPHLWNSDNILDYLSLTGRRSSDKIT